jgi:hypothetical protein
MNQQAREFARDRKHHWYGFWGFEGEATGRQFSLDDHTDLSWAPTDLQELLPPHRLECSQPRHPGVAEEISFFPCHCASCSEPPRRLAGS